MKFLKTVLLFVAALVVLSISPKKSHAQVDAALINQLSLGDLKTLGNNYLESVLKQKPCNCKDTEKDAACGFEECNKAPSGGVYTKLDRNQILKFDSVAYAEDIDSLHAVIFKITTKIVGLRTKEINGKITPGEIKDIKILELILFDYQNKFSRNKN